MYRKFYYKGQSVIVFQTPKVYRFLGLDRWYSFIHFSGEKLPVSGGYMGLETNDTQKRPGALLVFTEQERKKKNPKMGKEEDVFKKATGKIELR